MNKLSRILLIAAVATGTFTAMGCAHDRAAIEPVAPHVRMHRALRNLREARRQLEDAEDIFRHRRDEAMEQVDRALQNVVEGLREQGKDISTGELTRDGGFEGERFPHIHRALSRLRDARDELAAADKVFGGHRERALDHTDEAIRQVQECIHAAER